MLHDSHKIIKCRQPCKRDLIRSIHAPRGVCRELFQRNFSNYERRATGVPTKLRPAILVYNSTDLMNVGQDRTSMIDWSRVLAVPSSGESRLNFLHCREYTSPAENAISFHVRSRAIPSPYAHNAHTGTDLVRVQQHIANTRVVMYASTCKFG